MAIGNKIQSAIKAKNNNYDDLAKALNITLNAINKKFYRNSFSAEDLIKIADYLGYSLDFTDSGGGFTVSFIADDIKMLMGNKIKIAMSQKEKNEQDLADALKITAKSMEMKFYRDSFSAEDLIKIADCLGYSLELSSDGLKIPFVMDDIREEKR